MLSFAESSLHRHIILHTFCSSSWIYVWCLIYCILFTMAAKPLGHTELNLLKSANEVLQIDEVTVR